MTKPKRHHFVPRAYLQRFAEDGKVLVRTRDSRTYLANPQNVAVECGFYDVPDRGVTEKSSMIEESLAEIDGAAIEAMRRVDESGLAPESGDDRFALAIFLALQMSRTPEQRERVLFPRHVAEYAGERKLSKQVVSDFLEREHLGFRPSDKEVSAAFDFVSVAMREPGVLTAEFAMQLMLRSVDQLAPLLDGMTWTLELDRKERLITSDSPLVIWRTPSGRDRYEGFGVANAEELRFPLDPGKQLVLSPRKRTPTARITSQRVRSCNADMAAASHRFIVGRPSLLTMVQSIPLSERRPVLRFNTGPLYERGPNGTTEYRGEVLHMWTPRRSSDN